MASPIEDYGLISDMQTGALVSRSGSIDWLCLPRFDSESFFAALLGTEDHGRWLLAPVPEDSASAPVVVGRQYRDSTFILETIWRTGSGEVQVTDFMPVSDNRAVLVPLPRQATEGSRRR